MTRQQQNLTIGGIRVNNLTCIKTDLIAKKDIYSIYGFIFICPFSIFEGVDGSVCRSVGQYVTMYFFYLGTFTVFRLPHRN